MLKSNLKYKWQFTPRFRSQAFGWRSELPIQRIKEAVTEIKQVAKKEPAIAAEGAVLFLEKLVSAIEHVDGSSGAIGSAVNNALEKLALVIAKANVDTTTRAVWLARLWQAIIDDGYGYLDGLNEQWRILCVTPETASIWADEFLPLVELNWQSRSTGAPHFKGTAICCVALYGAGRYDELLALLDKAPYHSWRYHRWGVEALVSMGRIDEAIDYAETRAGMNVSTSLIASVCETILLNANRPAEAYERYAFQANKGTNNISTLRTVVKKYPKIPPEVILQDLVASHPGEEGKWFAAAKSLNLYDVAIELANQSPVDPHTLMRAAKDFMLNEPRFACQAGMAAMRWLILGYGYEMSVYDLMEAKQLTIQAAAHANIDVELIASNLRILSQDPRANQTWLDSI